MLSSLRGGSAGSPAVSGRQLYITGDTRDVIPDAGRSHALTCINILTGELLWNTVRNIRDGPQFVHSPTVVDGVVYAAEIPPRESNETGGWVGAYDAADGSQHWRRHLRSQPTTAPCVVSNGVYLGLDDGSLVSVDEGGSLDWRVEVGENPTGPLATDGATLYVGAGGAIHARAVEDGSEQWRADVGSGRPVLGEDLYVATGGSVHALAPEDGRTRWTFNPPDTGSSYSKETGRPLMPAVADDTIYIGTRTGLEDEEGSLHAVAAADGTERWRAGTDGRVSGQPAVTRGSVYVALGEYARVNLLAYDRETGDRRWGVELDNAPVGRPVPADGALHIVTTPVGSAVGDYLIQVEPVERATTRSIIADLAVASEETSTDLERSNEHLATALGAFSDRDYERVRTLVNQGERAVAAETAIATARQVSGLRAFCLPIANLLGRDARLHEARAAYAAGEYERAERLARRAQSAEGDAVPATGLAGLIGAGVVGGGVVGGRRLRQRRREQRREERRRRHVAESEVERIASRTEDVSVETPVSTAKLDAAREALDDNEPDRATNLAKLAERTIAVEAVLPAVEAVVEGLSAEADTVDEPLELEAVAAAVERSRSGLEDNDLDRAEAARDRALDRAVTALETALYWADDTVAWLRDVPERVDSIGQRARTVDEADDSRDRLNTARRQVHRVRSAVDDGDSAEAASELEPAADTVAVLLPTLAEEVAVLAEEAVSTVERTVDTEETLGELVAERLERARNSRAADDYRAAVEWAAAAERAASISGEIEDLSATVDFLQAHHSLASVSIDRIREQLVDARGHLRDGEDDRASDAVAAAQNRSAAAVESLATTAVERLEELEALTESMEQLEDCTREAQAALDAGEHHRAVRTASRCNEIAKESLPEIASDHESAAASAVDSGAYAEAINEFQAALTAYQQLAEIADATGDSAMADTVREAASTVEERLQKARESAATSIEERAERGDAALDRATSAAENSATREAAAAYAEATESFEAARDEARKMPATMDVDPDKYNKRIEAVQEGLQSIAESAVESCLESLPPEELVAAEDARRNLHAATDALEEDPRRAVELAVEASDAIRDAVRSYADERLAAGREAAASEEFDEALDALEAARSGYAHLREMTADEGTTAGLDSILTTVDEEVAEVRERATDRAESLADAAGDYADEADAAFREGDHEAARAAYTRAREQYTAAADLASSIGVGDTDRYREAADRMAERIGYTRLARHADRIEIAHEKIAEDPSTAAEAFADVTSDLRALDVPSGLVSDRDELIAEAKRGRLRARVETAREVMHEAEGLFDEADGYAARDRYQAALEQLEKIADDADDPESIPMLEELQDRCAANIERVKESLTGLARIRDEEGLQRVGAPGEPLPNADTVGGSTAGSASATTDEHGDPGGTAISDENNRRVWEGETDRKRSVAPGISIGAGAVEERLGRGPPAHERLERLGSGGNAEVWLVSLESGPARAALKRPQASGTLHRSDAERFLREAATWHRVDDHPNVVTVHDWGFAAEPWLLMAYAPDGDLSSLVGELSPSRAASLLADVAAALAHARGVDHLDVKPANVLLDGDQAMLADWGLARTAFGDGGQRGHTPGYAAPEQLDRELGPIDARTDIYQLGVTAYELLTGDLPYDPAAVDYDEQVSVGEAPPPSVRNGAVPTELDEIVMRAMAADRTDRYEAPIQLRDDLRVLSTEHEDSNNSGTDEGGDPADAESGGSATGESVGGDDR